MSLWRKTLSLNFWRWGAWLKKTTTPRGSPDLSINVTEDEEIILSRYTDICKAKVLDDRHRAFLKEHMTSLEPVKCPASIMRNGKGHVGSTLWASLLAIHSGSQKGSKIFHRTRRADSWTLKGHGGHISKWAKFGTLEEGCNDLYRTAGHSKEGMVVLL